MSELKPCPFCGCQTATDIKLTDIGVGSNYVMECDNCAASTGAIPYDEDTIEAWNTRASPWKPVSEEGLPPHGAPVICKRKNGTVDRGEISALYFDGLPAWYMPEGPVMTDDGYIVAWMEIPHG